MAGLARGQSSKGHQEVPGSQSKGFLLTLALQRDRGSLGRDVTRSRNAVKLDKRAFIWARRY